jgi:hypothetical protein
MLGSHDAVRRRHTYAGTAPAALTLRAHVVWRGRLLTDAPARLGSIADVHAHPCFTGVHWDQLRQYQAPFEPSLSSELDTSYFDDEETMSGLAGPRAGEDDAPAPHLRRVFAGFTYKHAHWRDSLGRAAAPAVTDADAASAAPTVLHGVPLGAEEDGSDVTADARMATSL